MTANDGSRAREAGVCMEEMTWPEYVERLAGGAVLLVPCGALEQHGPHLPMKADAFVATEFARRIAAEVGGIVAPSFFYGCKSQALSGGGQVFPGTTSLDSGTFAAVLRDVLREFLRHGARRIVVINGHGENSFPSYEGVDLALRGAPPEAKVLVVGWWQFVSDSRIGEIYPGEFPGWDLEHGAVTETSLMMALDPGCVHTDRMRDESMPYVPAWSTFPQPPDLVPPSGLLARTAESSPELGRLLIDTVMAGLREMLEREFGITA